MAKGQYTSWMRNRAQGTRRAIYQGASETKAIEMMAGAIAVLSEFKLTATLVVFDHTGASVWERDFIDGSAFAKGTIPESGVIVTHISCPHCGSGAAPVMTREHMDVANFQLTNTLFVGGKDKDIALNPCMCPDCNGVGGFEDWGMVRRVSAKK